MAQTHTLAVALGATYAGLTLRIQMADVLTGAAVNFASVGSSSGSAAWRTDADSDTWIVEGVDGTYTVRCTAWPDAGSLPVRVDIYNATGPVLLASGLLAQDDAAAVWDRLTTELTTTGSIGAWILANAGSGASPATFWTYETRTLTQGASSVIAAVTGSSVTVYRGVRWSITLTGLTDMTGQTGVWFGVKGNPREDTDTASVCLVKTTTGLIAFAGDATITAGHAAITVNSTTSITITVEADATQYATPGEYSYAVKALNASGKPFMVSSGGTFNVASDIPMAIS